MSGFVIKRERTYRGIVYEIETEPSDSLALAQARFDELDSDAQKVFDLALEARTIIEAGAAALTDPPTNH